jgi:hypothetical protein
MMPREIVEHSLDALVRGDIPGHVRFVADHVIWGLNENPSQQGKESYQQLLSLMADRETITRFQVDADETDSQGRCWIRVLERITGSDAKTQNGAQWSARST